MGLQRVGHNWVTFAFAFQGLLGHPFCLQCLYLSSVGSVQVPPLSQGTTLFSHQACPDPEAAGWGDHSFLNPVLSGHFCICLFQTALFSRCWLECLCQPPTAKAWRVETHSHHLYSTFVSSTMPALEPCGISGLVTFPGQMFSLSLSPAEVPSGRGRAVDIVAIDFGHLPIIGHWHGYKVKGLNCALFISPCSSECVPTTSCLMMRHFSPDGDTLLPSLRDATWDWKKESCVKVKAWVCSILPVIVFYACLEGMQVLVFSHILLKICGMWVLVI